MKVSVEHYLAAHRKTGLKAFVEHKIAADAVESKEPTDKDFEQGTAKTFVLSPTGGEIHRGESVVDRLNKPETLKEKVARFERLAKRVRQTRESLYMAMQDSVPDLEENPDDFEFEEGPITDEFGDTFIPTPVPKQPEPETVEKQETVTVNKPAADPVEADPTTDPE